MESARHGEKYIALSCTAACGTKGGRRIHRVYKAFDFSDVEGRDIVQQLLQRLGIKQQVPFDFSFKNSTLHLVGTICPLGH